MKDNEQSKRGCHTSIRVTIETKVIGWVIYEADDNL